MSSAHWSASQFWWLHRLFARAIDLWPRNSGPMKCPGILWWQHVASFYWSDHSQLVLRLQAHKRPPNHPMQWTRDEAQWCGQSSGREPLIGAVRSVRESAALVLIPTLFVLLQTITQSGTWAVQMTPLLPERESGRGATQGWQSMPRGKKEQAEQIIPKLRECEVEAGRAKTVEEAKSALGLDRLSERRACLVMGQSRNTQRRPGRGTVPRKDASGSGVTRLTADSCRSASRSRRWRRSPPAAP